MLDIFITITRKALSAGFKIKKKKEKKKEGISPNLECFGAIFKTVDDKRK